MKDARPKPPEDWLQQFKRLLAIANKKLSYMPIFEIREIEHSLCEWNKYERMRLSEGKSKRKYKGA